MNDEQRFARMLDVFGFLWSQKKIVAGGTVLATVVGVAYALLATPVYVSSAVIVPKEISPGLDRSSLGGGFASVLNSRAGVGQLNRLEVVLGSNEIARRAIAEHDLLPALFPDQWDASRRDWKNESESPTLAQGVRLVSRMLRTDVDSYKMILKIDAHAPDSTLSFRVVQAYLEELNKLAKEGVIKDAAANRAYLEAQLDQAHDPWTREKIQDLIVRQIESGMLMNANAFEVLDSPEVPLLRDSPKRRFIVIAFAASGFVLSVIGVFFMRALRNVRGRSASVRAFP